MSRYLLLLPLFVAMFPAQSDAGPRQITLSEVEQVLNESEGRLQRLLDDVLKTNYEELDLSWQMEEPVYEFSEQNILLDESCDSTTILERIQGTLTLRDSSDMALDLVTLAEPATLSLTMNTDLDTTGKVKQDWGFWGFGSCTRYAEYGFNFDADGELVLGLDVTVIPQVEFVDEGIKYTPTFSVQSRIEHIAYNIDVDDDAFSSMVKEEIDSAIQPFLDQAVMDDFSRQLEQQLQQSVIRSWGAEFIVIQLPELDQQRLDELVARFEQEYQKYTEDEFYLQNNLAEVYYVLLSGDDEVWDNLLNNSAICELSENLMVQMPSEPLYQRSGVACLPVDEAGLSVAGSYYSDAACQQVVNYEPQSLSEYCAEISALAQPVHSPAQVDEPLSWYQSPATRLDIGVESIAGNHRPYTSRTVYKQTKGERGQCALEMRIHKRSIAATGLKPLLMLHGGSWERRRNGIVAMESQISSYTEQGFVVFAPTYRLAGETEGDPACNGATGEQIVADVNDALSWVQEHGGEYGAEGGPVAVFGQSAGGHLALRMAVRRPDQISRLLLLYPATDFADFLSKWRTGELGEQPDGLEALQAFIGTSVDTVQLTDSVIAENSVPPMIAEQPERFPPMFIIHGGGDSLVPVSQSVRLCNALSGNAEQGPVGTLYTSVAEGHSQSFACDQRGSQLHVITAAEHMLDGCLFSLLCPAGGVESQRVVEDLLGTGRDWLAEQTTVPVPAGLVRQWR